jgi:hypothetical protein
MFLQIHTLGILHMSHRDGVDVRDISKTDHITDILVLLYRLRHAARFSQRPPRHALDIVQTIVKDTF